jgi:hypothetical protein
LADCRLLHEADAPQPWQRRTNTTIAPLLGVLAFLDSAYSAVDAWLGRYPLEWLEVSLIGQNLIGSPHMELGGASDVVTSTTGLPG